MRKLFAVMALFGGLSLAAADPYFYSTVKHVDIGGEMLVYSNISVATKALNNIALKIGKAVGAENETVRCAINCALNLLDVTSFKAFAQSSVEVEPGFFVHKAFVNFDNLNSNSILSGKAFPDTNMDFLPLPADTRLAIVTNVNLGYIWKRVNDEIENNGDRVMTRWFVDFKAEAMRNGIDIPKIAESINGPVTLLVTGESVRELKVMLIVTDKNGSIGAALRKSGLLPRDGENIYHFGALPFLPGSRDAQLRYENGYVMFVSDPQIRAAGKKLGDLPLYCKYAQVLPKNGHSMILFDLSQKMIDDIRGQLPYQARGVFNLKPVSIVFIEKNYPDGFGAVTASNFSVPMEIFNVLERLTDSIIEMTVAPRRRAPKYDRYESKPMKVERKYEEKRW